MRQLLGDDMVVKGAAAYLDQVIGECREVVELVQSEDCACPASRELRMELSDSLEGGVSPSASSTTSSWGATDASESMPPTPCACGTLPVSVFDAEEIPTITCHQYLKRWLKALPIQVIPIAMVYVQRWLEMDDTRLLTESNVHRVLLAALVLAVKWFCDQPHSLGFFSHTGGVLKQELPRLEVTFLKEIDFDCYVSPADFVSTTLAMRELAEE